MLAYSIIYVNIIQILGVDNNTHLCHKTCRKSPTSLPISPSFYEVTTTQSTTSLVTTAGSSKGIATFESQPPSLMTTTTLTTSATPLFPSYSRFVSSASSCQRHNVANSYLKYFAKLSVAKDKNAKTVCGLECLTNAKCSAFGFTPDYRVCVLFKKVAKVEEEYDPLVLAECFLKI